MIKRFVIALVLLILVCGGLIGFNIYRNQAIQQYFANMPAQTVSVSTITAEPSSWTPTIEAIGTASAANGVDLTVEVSGIVSEVHFKANDQVEKGALLVQLDDAMQQADLASAQAQNKLDQANLKRAQELQQRQVGAEVNVETAHASADASAAAVAKAQAAIDQKQIKAPFAGVIGISRVQLGEYLQPGTAVATLQSLDVMRVDFTIPERDLPRVKIGQPVRIGFNGSETPFQGTVQGIDPKVDPSSRLVNVQAQVANPDGKLTPGQFVEVNVELPKEENVIALPQTAVVTSLYGDYVYVVEPADKVKAGSGAGQPGDETSSTQSGNVSQAQAQSDDPSSAPSLAVKQVFVKTGRRNGQLVEVRDGVSAGDQVVTAGQNRLNNGTPVAVNNDRGDGSGSSQAGGQ